mmetsp:Transcript_44855/g.124385  ORF Transcript_44855/g.124385 Transcript_44855/m.124385 type:complete len:244 (-) Transcript_44855:2087-2818(-)
MTTCGVFHMEPARTTLTFCPPESAPMRVCVANSAARPTSPRCVSTNFCVSGRTSCVASAAILSSTCLMSFLKPLASSFDLGTQVEKSPCHATSYSYSLPLDAVRRPSVKRLKMHFCTLTTPSSVLYSIRMGALILASSSGVSLAVSFSRPSLSEPYSYRQRMYSFGVFSRWFSMWWKACCATYATRQLGCFHTSPEPLSGTSSPVRSLIMVDLPAPLAPMHAARVESEMRTVTPVSCALAALG